MSQFLLLALGVLPALPRELDLLLLAEVEAWDEARCRVLFLDFFSSLDRLFFSFSLFFLLLFSSASDSVDDDVDGEGDLEDLGEPMPSSKGEKLHMVWAMIYEFV